MPDTGRRRNGTEASCEPCRKRKMKCGHEKPTCASCRRRNIEARCWYHPAPLSKPRGTHAHAQRLNPLTPQSPARHASDVQDAPSSPACTPPPGAVVASTGSAEHALKRHVWPLLSTDVGPWTAQARPRQHRDEATHREHLAMAEEIVARLRSLDRIENLIEADMLSRYIAVVPRAIIREFLDSFKTSLAAAQSSGNTHQLAKDIVHNSASAVTVTPSLDPKGFCALFSGARLRVETLGLVYASAARCHFEYVLYTRGEKEEDDGFAHQLFRCAKHSLRLARELSPFVNDVLMWLANEVTQGVCSIEGSASLSAWRGLSDLATDMCAMGLHREATYAEEAVPFFLSEYRRRLFAFIFNIDKAFAAIFNQPPRIPSRYADSRPPLDLTDEELFAFKPEDLVSLRSQVTEEGWSKTVRYTTSTWARLRHALAELRGDLVEFQLRVAQPVDETELRGLSTRCYEVWNSLPQHIRCGQDLKATNMPSITRLMLTKVYLSFVHVSFHVFKLLYKDSTGPAPPELLEVSAKMLEGVMLVVMDRARTPFLCDLPEDILFYALPSAVVLISALQDGIRDPARRLPASISKSSVVRHLSVLVSQLENLASPQAPTYAFCMQAARSISKKLDQIIEGSLNGADGGLQGDSPVVNLYATRQSDNGSALLPEDAATVATAVFDGVNFEAWATNWDFDLGASGTEWGIF